MKKKAKSIKKPAAAKKLKGIKKPTPKKQPRPKATFEVLPAGALRRKHGLVAENRPVIKLDPKRVPKPLRKLIPLAEKFGVSDDLLREDVFERTPQRELEKLQQTLSEHADQLDDWLAGSESGGPRFSDEYIAFSAMRISTDFL